MHSHLIEIMKHTHCQGFLGSLIFQSPTKVQKTKTLHISFYIAKLWRILTFKSPRRAKRSFRNQKMQIMIFKNASAQPRGGLYYKVEGNR